MQVKTERMTLEDAKNIFLTYWKNKQIIDGAEQIREFREAREALSTALGKYLDFREKHGQHEANNFPEIKEINQVYVRLIIGADLAHIATKASLEFFTVLRYLGLAIPGSELEKKLKRFEEVQHSIRRDVADRHTSSPIVKAGRKKPVPSSPHEETMDKLRIELALNLEKLGSKDVERILGELKGPQIPEELRIDLMKRTTPDRPAIQRYIQSAKERRLQRLIERARKLAGTEHQHTRIAGLPKQRRPERRRIMVG